MVVKGFSSTTPGSDGHWGGPAAGRRRRVRPSRTARHAGAVSDRAGTARAGSTGRHARSSRTGQHDAKSALLHRFQQRRSRDERPDLPDQPIEFLDPGVAERVTVLALDVVAGDVPNVFGAP